MQLWRTIEDQSDYALQKIVSADREDLELLGFFVDEYKPHKTEANESSRLGYDYLIFTSFRYPPPVPPCKAARFRPPHSLKNVFYGATDLPTSIDEHAYYFMRERRHLPNPTGSNEPRLNYTVAFDATGMIDLTGISNIAAIIDRQDYSESHVYITENPCDSLLYPSARNPKGKCVACFEITKLGKRPNSREQFRFTYDKGQDSCQVQSESREIKFDISWQSIS